MDKSMMERLRIFSLNELRRRWDMDMDILNIGNKSLSLSYLS